MAEPVYEGPVDPIDEEEASALDPSTPFIDRTAAGPQVAAPGTPELADADETLAGAPNAVPSATASVPGTVQSGLKSNTQIQGNFAGLVEPGNIDLTARPQVKNPDGSTSTVRSASFGLDGKEVLLPTVSDGPNARLLSDDEAIAQYRKTGKHLGKFANPDAADAYAEALHKQQSTAYGLDGPKVPGTVQEAGAGSFGATMEGAKAGEDKASAVLEESDVEKQRLDQARQDEEDIRVQRQLEAQSQLDARNEFAAKKDAADAKVRDFKFHDYFDDPKHGSKALARFAVFLGGLGNLGGQAPGSPNRALDALETNIKADHDEQLSYLNSAKYFADKQAEGVTDLAKQQASDRQQLELEYANKKLATADKFAELAQTARGKQNYDAAMIEVAKLKKSAYDDQQKVFGDIAKQHLEDLQGQAALARASRYAHKGGGGGGGGSGEKLAAFEAAAQAIPPGAPVPKEVYDLAYKAGFKTKDVQAQVDKARESGKKSLPAKGAGGTAPGELPKDAVVYGGKPIGLAPSGRGGAAGFEKSLIAYDDGLESLKALKQYRLDNPVLGRLAKGDAYNRAVLAIAATTTANASDSTTKHEADTLKGLTFIDPDAIQTSIDHIRERRDALLGTLRPLPKVGEAEHTPAKAAALDRLKSLGADIGAYGG